MEAERGRPRGSMPGNGTTTNSFQNAPSNELYVCHLPEDIQEDNIRQIFEEYGTITRIFSKSKDDGFTFAFVSYQDQSMATQALHRLNGAKVGQKNIKVCYSKGKKQNKNFGDSEQTHRPRKQFRGDMDSSDNSARSDSQSSRDGGWRGRGRGGGRGRGRGGFENRNNQSDVRKKFGGNERKDFGRKDGNFRDRDERGGRDNGEDRRFRGDRGGRGGFGGNQNRGDRKPGACFKCQQMGHRANQCPNQGNSHPQNNRKHEDSKMSEEEICDY